MLSVHILRDGRRLGIFQPGDIRILAAKGYFRQNDLAWHKGMPNWAPLVDVVPGVGRAPAKRRERYWISHRIPFFATLPLAPAYPFRQGGRGFLGACGVLLLAAFAWGDFTLAGSPISWLPLGVVVLLAVGYLPQLVHASAIGDEVPPPFPSLDRDWKSFFHLYALAALATVACLLPLGVYVAHTATPLEAPESRWAVLAGVGLFLAPMAVLRAVIFRNLADALHPIRVVASIVTVLFPYLVLLAVAASLPAFVSWCWIRAENAPEPVRMTLCSLTGLYLLMLGARLLGLISYSQRKRLAWFG